MNKLGLIGLSLLLAIFTLNTGCSNNSEEKETKRKGKGGVYFTPSYITFGGEEGKARTILPNYNEISKNYSDIVLYKKAATLTREYKESDVVTSIDKYNDLMTPELYEVKAGLYNFKVTLNILLGENKVKFAQELKNIEIKEKETVILLFNDIRKTEETVAGREENTGKIEVKFRAYSNVIGEDVKEIKVFMDNESVGESASWTEKKEESGKLEYVEGSWIKNDLPPGGYKVTFTFIDSKKNTVLYYPMSAVVYKDLTSKASITIKLEEENVFDIHSIIYDSNGGEGENVIKRIKPGLKTLEFKDTGWREPSGKKFLCYSTIKDLSATVMESIDEGLIIGKENNTLPIYDENTDITFSTDTVLYAQYLSYDSTNGYKIENEGDLYVLFHSNRGIKKGSRAILNKDIKMKSKVWYPIKTYGGILEGNNKTIESLTIEGGTSGNGGWTITPNATTGDYTIINYAAFIETLVGEIRNLTITNSNIKGEKGAATIAYYLGESKLNENKEKVNTPGVLQNCKVTNSNIVGRKHGDNLLLYGGGIAGVIKESSEVINCTIQDCTVIGGLCGGIAGENYGSILFKTSDGNINTDKTLYKLTGRIGDSNSTYSGGIAGFNGGSGEIKGACSVSFVVSPISSGYYGSVIGRFEAKARANIETNIERGKETEVCDIVYTVSTESYQTRTIELSHTGYVWIKLTDYSGGGAIYGSFSIKQNGDVNSTYIGETDKLNGTTDFFYGYYNAGTISAKLENKNIVDSSQGRLTITCE